MCCLRHCSSVESEMVIMRHSTAQHFHCTQNGNIYSWRVSVRSVWSWGFSKVRSKGLAFFLFVWIKWRNMDMCYVRLHTFCILAWCWYIKGWLHNSEDLIKILWICDRMDRCNLEIHILWICDQTIRCNLEIHILWICNRTYRCNLEIRILWICDRTYRCNMEIHIFSPFD